MKLTHLALVASLAAPAFAQESAKRPAPPKSFDATSVPAVEAVLDQSFFNLVVLVHQGQATEPQLQFIREHLDLWVQANAALAPRAAELRDRLQRFVDELIQRARTAFVTELEAAYLREQFIEARLDLALTYLEARAAAGNWDEDAYRRVVAGLVARARAAVGYPSVELYQARLEAALEDARASATGVVTQLRQFRLELIRSRVMRAYEFLVQRARITGATRAEAMPLVELLY